MGTDLSKPGAFDERILSLADHMSPEQISRELGDVVTPARVALRIHELLKAQDWLSLAEQDRLVTYKMRKILTKLEGQYMDLDSAKVQVKVLQAIGTRLDKRAAATTEDLQTYNANVGRTLGRVVDLALTYMKGALREQVDPELWDSLVMDALEQARREIERGQSAIDD